MIYAICPSCQRQTVTDATQPEMDTATSSYTPDPAHQMVARQAMDAAVQIDDLRRQKAEGDALKDRVLADIESGFMQNIADVGRRLQRSDGQGNQP